MALSADVQPLIMNLVRRLVEEVAPCKIVLFGSYALGEPERDSDIDLLIIADTREDFFTRVIRARRAVSGLHPGIPLDLIVLTPQEVEERLSAGDQFIAEALERGVTLYAA